MMSLTAKRIPCLSLFFSDKAVQVQLEEILESHDFQNHDEKRVLDCLLLQSPETTLIFPDDRGVLKLSMPDKGC